ncbi:hypothetical protein Hanom_Chr13g01203321 [Helianthus anomalus]
MSGCGSQYPGRRWVLTLKRHPLTSCFLQKSTPLHPLSSDGENNWPATVVVAAHVGGDQGGRSRERKLQGTEREKEGEAAAAPPIMAALVLDDGDGGDGANSGDGSDDRDGGCQVSDDGIGDGSVHMRFNFGCFASGWFRCLFEFSGHCSRYAFDLVLGLSPSIQIHGFRSLGLRVSRSKF